jgi:hypothetical protein
VSAYNLYSYFNAAILLAFGGGIAGVKLLSVIPSVLGVVFLYLTARFAVPALAAFLGCALLASSRWHLIHSRFEWDSAFVVACCAAAAYVSLLALRRRRLSLMCSAGVLAGVAQVGYLSGRLLAAAFLAWLAWTMLHRSGPGEPTRRRRGAFLTAWLLGFLIGGAPVVLHSVTQPEQAFMRVREVGRATHGEPSSRSAALVSKTLGHLGSLVYEGPTNSRRNVSGKPLLSPLMTVLAGLGILYQLMRRRRCRDFSFVWFLFFFSMMNSVLTRGDDTLLHTRRAAGLHIPLGVLLAMGVQMVFELYAVVSRRAGSGDWVRTASGAGLLIALGTGCLFHGWRSLSEYFDEYGKSAHTRRAMGNGRELAIAEFLARTAEDELLWIDSRFNHHALSVLLWARPSRQRESGCGAIGTPCFQRVVEVEAGELENGERAVLIVPTRAAKPWRAALQDHEDLVISRPPFGPQFVVLFPSEREDLRRRFAAFRSTRQDRTGALP